MALAPRRLEFSRKGIFLTFIFQGAESPEVFLLHFFHVSRKTADGVICISLIILILSLRDIIIHHGCLLRGLCGLAWIEIPIAVAVAVVACPALGILALSLGLTLLTNVEGALAEGATIVGPSVSLVPL